MAAAAGRRDVARDGTALRAALSRLRADIRAGDIRELSLERLRSRYRLSRDDARACRAAMLRDGLVERRGQRYMARQGGA